MKRKNHINLYGKIIVFVLIVVAILLPFASRFLFEAETDDRVESLTIDNTNSDFKELSTQVDSEVSSMNASQDPYSDSQWYIYNSGSYYNYIEGNRWKVKSVKGIDMDVPKAWDSMEKTNSAKRKVIVAIIDTGVDYSHPDLTNNMWINYGEVQGDHIDNDNNGYKDDVYGWDFYNNDASTCHYNAIGKKNTASTKDNDNHGTHIAGVIAAVANNKIGIAGVASNIDIKIMTLKINGGADANGKMSDAIEAIKYATMMGADICNLSWGTTEYSVELKEAMKESDMLFVAAAGNSGKNNDEEPLYPANFKLDNLITVTSIDSWGELNKYSNYGTKMVDMAAPGDDIYSTIVGGYASMSGSSMAVPQVTAVAALLYAFNDNSFASDVKKIIIDNLKSLPDLKGMMKYAGIPDVYQAVMDAGKLSQDTANPKMSFKTIYNKTEMTIPINVVDSGNSKIRVIKWIYGKKTVKDFKRGINGTLVENNQISISDAGVYTFYASDYAGNETAVTYKVVSDTESPNLIATYTVEDNYKSRTVTINASDEQSGLKRIKYMSGVKSAKDFLPSGAGTEITLKGGKRTFDIKKDGTYTVFASDYRGNLAVKVIKVKTVKATGLEFTEIKNALSVGDERYLKPNVMPLNTTDKIVYSSTNEQVATVTSTGKVKAKAEGTTIIMARTSSGLKAFCIITVNLDG